MSIKESILIVDDDENVSQILKFVLNEAGYIVEIVKTGKEAIKRIQKKHFNITFLDIRLPDIEGTKLISSLKEHLPDMVVMMITGYSSQETAIEAMNKGASAYITKPIDTKNMLDIIRKTLNLQRLEREKETLHKQLQQELVERKKVEEELVQAKNSLEDEVKIRTRELFEEKQRIETILSTIPDGILVLNADGTLILANSAFEYLYRQCFEQQIPLGFNIYNQPSIYLWNKLKDLLSAKKTNPMLEIIEPLKRLFIQVQYTSIATSDEQNANLGSLFSFRDITKFVEYDNLRKRIVSTVSHELRTPITSIALSIENLYRLKKELSEQQQDRLIGIIRQNSSLMKQLIEDILSLSGIESQKIELEYTSFNLHAILSDAIIQLESSYQTKKMVMKLNVSPEIDLYGDTKRITQIFRIFIDNAIKFSESQSTITIAAIDNYKGKFNNDNVKGTLIQVSDQGIGIRQEDIERIFDSFFRTEEVKNIPGTGLGLSIAKEFVLLHKGEIYVESIFGKGSTFSVFFPQLKKLEDIRC